MVATRLRPFGASVFAEMTELANRHQAINLSQGFPDFDGPAEIFDAALAAMRAGANQYARSRGHLELVRAISETRAQLYGLSYDPETEVVVFSGATEGILSSLLGLLNPGDEVILIEPFYDSYPVCVTLAGAVPRYVTLKFPDFALDVAELERQITKRTRVLVLNTPHNPTGKVFTPAELGAVADLCVRHDLVVLADEVYEHLTFDGRRHLPIATVPGMRERTLTLSSTGKTFSLTGWKVGWATGPQRLVDAAQAAHQFVTFATATPFQVAMATALRRFILGGDYLADFQRQYAARRDFLVRALTNAGFAVAIPAGTYFIVADFSRLSSEDDQTFARRLVTEHGVATIPPGAFYAAHPEEGRRLLRFAFCKRLETLEAAAARLRALR
ncbi:MAG: aminotransferase class I/II-fold pyridoxal phosphate-dependent enzyme [Deltaproteobacteria bacterium]|nr:aminotransferase class I/II-fold pyridoxal phosphate-dependent enzyme [Deltaproteobacteria bacterium]